MFEIADMEDRKDELDIGVMTDTSRSFLATRLATIRAIGDSLFKWLMIWCTVNEGLRSPVCDLVRHSPPSSAQVQLCKDPDA